MASKMIVRLPQKSMSVMINAVLTEVTG